MSDKEALAAEAATLQQVFDAPSWSINKHRIVRKIVLHFEQVLIDVLSGI